MDVRTRTRLVGDLRRKYEIDEKQAGTLVDAGLRTVAQVEKASVEIARLGMAKPKVRVRKVEG